jgi:hypothetical protein
MAAGSMARKASMQPRSMWEILNSPLVAGVISGFVQALVTAIIGGLIIALGVGLVVVSVQDHWQEDRKRRELQFQVFKEFNDSAADLIVRLTDLYHLRGNVPDPEFRSTAREAASRKLRFVQMDAIIAGAFRDETLFQDLLDLKASADFVQKAATQTPARADLALVEPHQDDFLDRAKIMKMKMMREMGMLPTDEYKRGIKRLQERLRERVEARTATK